MKRLRVPFYIAACLCVTTETAAADGPLTLHANEASAQLASREHGPQQVSLPSLEFSLLVNFECPSDADVESVTASVADVQKRYGNDEIADKTALDVRVSVPAEQIAPLSAADFCINGGPGYEEGLLVPGIATAQVSLRCRSDNEVSVFFASVVLPLRLYCEPNENHEASTDR